MSDQTNSSVFADQIVVKFQNNQNNNYCYSRQTPPSRATGDGVDDVIRKPPPPIAQLQNELKSWRSTGRDRSAPPGRTWRTVLWNYSQATTFHGLVHVTATQPFRVRRFVSFAFFVAFLSALVLSTTYVTSFDAFTVKE